MNESGKSVKRKSEGKEIPSSSVALAAIAKAKTRDAFNDHGNRKEEVNAKGDYDTESTGD